MKARFNKDKTQKEIEVMLNRAYLRGKVNAYIGICKAMENQGLCENTIKKVIGNSEKCAEEIGDELLDNKVIHKNGKSEKVDKDANREILHQFCRQYDFDFTDEIFDRKWIDLTNIKEVLM